MARRSWRRGWPGTGSAGGAARDLLWLYSGANSASDGTLVFGREYLLVTAQTGGGG
jgi:hypothetical protein